MSAPAYWAVPIWAGPCELGCRPPLVAKGQCLAPRFATLPYDALYTPRIHTLYTLEPSWARGMACSAPKLSISLVDTCRPRQALFAATPAQILGSTVILPIYCHC